MADEYQNQEEIEPTQEAPTEEAAEPVDPTSMMAGADFVPPDISDDAREFVTRCREMIYSEKFLPVVQQALTGANDLASGVAPVILQLITAAEDKMGPLSDEDFQKVAQSLAGTLVGLAKMMGDPDAEDIPSAVQEVMAQVSDMTSEENATAQAPDGGMPPAPAEPAPPQTMAGMMPQ